MTTGPACVEVCDEARGDFLRVGHPDCSETNAICDPWVWDGLGLCNAG